MSNEKTKSSCCDTGSCSKKVTINRPKAMIKKNQTIIKSKGVCCDTGSCNKKVKTNLSNKTVNIKKISPKPKSSCCQDDSCCSDGVQNNVDREPLKGNVQSYVIEGMDCGVCAQTLEKHLKGLSYVKQVTVNFSTGKMQIVHEGKDEDIIKEIKKAGYSGYLITKGGTLEKGSNKSTGILMVIISGIFMIIGFIGSYMNMPEIISNILYAITMIITGYKPVKSAYFAVKSKSLDMNVLMSAAAIGSAFIGQWLEGASVLWLFYIGNQLQNKSIEKTRNSIQGLIELAPPEAWVKNRENVTLKAVEDIFVGDIIVVKPGEKIPLDGEIVAGETSINQAPITGESVPVDKAIGDQVFSGTINDYGSIEVKVTKLVSDSTISRIIHMVEEAQSSKAPIQSYVDKFAKVYTPIVFILSLSVMILPPMFGFGAWGQWIYKGLALLIVACPCALVISTPVAIVSAIGNAAKNGVLIKGGTFLEVAGSISAIAFDKTGTLTEGKPKVSQVITIEGEETRLLSIARTIEEHSRHPIALAVLEYALKKDISTLDGNNFKAIVGKGAKATIDGIDYYAGNLRLFEELNVPLQEMKELVNQLQNEGNTLVIIGTCENILGIITVADSIRENAFATVEKLKDVGISKVIMLTGDNEGTAKKIADTAGVNDYFSELLPGDKARVINDMQSKGDLLAMVGDGINDAPALATATLGIAMGGAGTDAAMETANIVLMADNIEKLPYTISLSRRALRIIKQNIWFSLIIKFIALIFIFPGWLMLWVAVLSDTGAALLVILNSMRLLRSNEGRYKL